MPEVPTVDAPTVTQSGAPININTPDSAFGASVIAGGLDKIAGTQQQASDMLEKHAEQYQAINNKAEADSAFVTHLNAANQYATDFQANNLGIKASQNLGTAMTDLDKQRTDIGDTLSNPTARAMFDADSRRATANITGELTRFASSQRKQYVLKQSTAVQEALASDTVIHPDQFGPNMAKMMEQQVGINEQLGLSPEEGDLEARKLYGNTVAMVSETMAGNGNITGASAFLDAHKEGMDGKVYEQTLMKLRPAVMANDAAIGGAQAADDALHGLNSPLGPSVDYLSNVHGREGSGQNPHSSANGIGQFTGKIGADGKTSGTWFDMMKKPEFAQDVAGKTPQQILDMRKDPAVANRAILAYAQDNAGVLAKGGYNVSAASVGLLHGYGPDAGPKILSAFDQNPTEKIDSIIGAQTAKNNGVSGQTVAQVVGTFQTRFGTNQMDANNNGTPSSYQIRGRLDTAVALATQQAQAKYPGNQTMVDQYVAKATAQITHQAAMAADNEGVAFQNLAQVAGDNQIQDLPTLLKTVPNGLQMYNSLPQSQRTSLQAAIHHNATDITSSREANIVQLNGMWGSRSENPQAFLNADIANLDLPLTQKIDFLKKQSELRGKPQIADPQAKMLMSITKTPEYKSLIGPDALNIKSGSDEEYTLRGSIAGQLEDWYTQHPTEPPKTKDIQAMIARSAGQHSFHNEIFGMKIGNSFTEQSVPQISDDDKAGISRQLTKLNIPVTPFTIAKFYQQHAPQAGTK